MKIVAIVERSWYGVAPSGGAETMIHSLMKYLVTKGWEVHAVACIGPPTTTTVDGVTVTFTEDKHRIHEIVKSADLVVTHLGATHRGVSMGRIYEKPVVQLIHNTNEFSIGFLGDSCDFAIYNAEWVAEFHDHHANDPIINSLQRGGHSIIRARRCFEWPSIVVRPPADETPGRMGSKDGYITLVNLTPNKGPDILYALAHQNPDLKFRGVLGGYDFDKQDVRSLPNVDIFEHTKDVDRFYSEASIILMPSKYESYGRVAVEGMARGIPVIVTGTPGLREAVGAGGLFVDDRDDLDVWQTRIETVFNKYDFYSQIGRSRYKALQAQTKQELEDLDATLRTLL